MTLRNRLRPWLLPALIILFVIQILLLPAVLGVTYATKSRRPEHILTYSSGMLRWDANTSVREDGSASLSFFDTLDQNVSADGADKILAPGTQKDTVVRLKNNAKNAITYTAVLWMRRSSGLLPVEAALSGEGFSDTDEAVLPAGAASEDVLRTVSGTVGANQMQDFDIDWFWRFEADRDTLDTYLGDLAANGKAADVTLGFYLVVNDGGSVNPQPPDTGDKVLVWGYLVLMAFSAAAIILLLVGKKRRKKNA